MLISEQERDALYKTLFARRDVRRNFRPEPIPEEVLQRILMAAHHAPSVGFMQPWDFVLVEQPETRASIRDGFVEASGMEAEIFEGERQQLYRSLKLEGITDSAMGIVVTCDRKRMGEQGLGRVLNPEMSLYSTVCAIQNLWLAARAENVGVGWVSILDYEVLRRLLGIPDSVDVIAYLCVGYTDGFAASPDLEQRGWQDRLPLSELIHRERW
ncbi:5,6-dimethylbenzimidazole synthase [Marinobacterium jannaschii]|uniref:5,6-dimethylbenzimidazole synthase n=1 Tax=Marinobacterium jannaschii TaxID=64970 RepID=UPI000486846D|nr:5,6-dimethylbenzimidazole synthase [Marinobacterium jannaschii]